MDSDLSLEFLRVVEQAAIACAHTMGQGDRHGSDQAAVETMRRTMDDMDVTDRRTALLHFLDGATTDELEDLKAALAEIEARADDERPAESRRRGIRGR